MNILSLHYLLLIYSLLLFGFEILIMKSIIIIIIMVGKHIGK